MLATLLIWLYTLFMCYVYGGLILDLTRRCLRLPAKLPALPLVLVSGLIVLTTLASFFSLFVQIGLLVNLVLLGGAVAALWARLVPLPRLARPAALLLLVLALAAVVVLENTTHRPLNPDTNIYHAQAIHWIESYAAVPGLGNLHGRLAFNSAWFVSNALFSLSFLGLRSFHLAASVLFLAALLFFWDGFRALARGEMRVSTLLKLLFLPLAFSQLGAELSSPGTDLPASLLLWLLAVLWAETGEAEEPFHPLLGVLLASFALTVKLSAAPALLLGLFFFVEAVMRRELRQAGALAACAALVLLPFVARNLVLSGYLIYPFPALDLFSFDWKVPLQRAVDEALSIRAWGRFPRMDAAQALAMPFGGWFPRWLADQTANRQGLFLAAALSPLAAIPAWLARLPSRRTWFGWLVFCGGTLFWLFSAPDFRFGYGFLFGAVLLALAPWLAAALRRSGLAPERLTTPAALLVLAYLGFTLVTSFEPATFSARLLLPADYDRVATQACALANASVSCAKAYNACSYQAFPCIPGPRPWVELRGPSLGDGFRARTP